MTFEEYATGRLPTLLGTARAICGQTALAEDVLQEVLIKVHARWDTIEHMAARDAYVRRMLVNEMVSWHRKWARLIPHADPAPLSFAPDQAEAVVERDALYSDIAKLPARQRVVIGLRYFADLDDEEIAADLGCALSTVRVHAARALATLRIARDLSPRAHPADGTTRTEQLS